VSGVSLNELYIFTTWLTLGIRFPPVAFITCMRLEAAKTDPLVLFAIEIKTLSFSSLMSSAVGTYSDSDSDSDSDSESS